MTIQTIFVAIVASIFFGLIIYIRQIKRQQNLINELSIANSTAKQQEMQLQKQININEDLQEQIYTQLEQISTLKEREKNLQELKAKLQIDFENLSTKILEESRTKLMVDNSHNLKLLLEPLQQHINKLETNHKDYLKETASLQSEIKNIMLMNKELSNQSLNLANALRGDKKLQGNWGEFQLEKILELSGLIKDIDYTLQGKSLNLRNDNNDIARPDVIINLPENKHIVIDSKVSLISYEKYYNSANPSINEEEDHNINKETYLKEFIGAIKNHIDSLSQKAYHNLDKLISAEYTIMFMPLESAYMLAISSNSNLHEYALSKNIMLVSTNNLIAILRTIAHMLALEKRNKNADEIASLAGKMYDKFVSFVSEIEKVGAQIQKSQDTYNNAYKMLTLGNGNLVNRAKRLQDLGAKTAKKLHTEESNLLEELEIELED